MILNHQAKWRCTYRLRVCIRSSQQLPAHGLWGQAKFQSVDFAPFAAMVQIIHLSLSLFYLSRLS